MSVPRVMHFEDLMEDMFDINFTVVQHEFDPFSRVHRRTEFEVFEPEFIMYCEEFLRDLPNFLRRNVANYLSENVVMTLAYEILSYHQAVIQRTSSITTGHRSIPLTVFLHVQTISGQGSVPWYFHLVTDITLDASIEYMMAIADNHEPTETTQQSSVDNQHVMDVNDARVSNEINLAVEQSVQQFFTTPASEKTIASLKKMKISCDEVDASQCSICFEPFDEAEDVSPLTCGHCFHMDCLVKWLKINHTCPLCRFQLPT